MTIIYLDNSATTPLAPDVLEAMIPFLRDEYANPSSVHTPGQRVRAAMEDARQWAGRMIGARSFSTFFTAGGTESDNLAILGTVRAQAGRGRHIITSTIEHAAVRNTMDHLESEGFEITRLKVDRQARVSVDDFAAAIRKDTILASVMHVNNEIGTIQPIAEMAAVARKHRIPFHTDAVQSVGKIPVDVEALGVDLLTYSSHKIHGPKGCGVLYIRQGTPWAPIIHGGGQEKGRRPGTENVAGIVGTGVACRLALENLESSGALIAGLRDGFERGILSRVEGAVLHAAGADRVASISNFSFPDTEGEAVVISLDLKGVIASAGSACSSGSIEPPQVLKAMGVGPDLLHSAVRFSLSRYNTQQEIEQAVDIIPGVITAVRRSMGF